MPLATFRFVSENNEILERKLNPEELDVSKFEQYFNLIPQTVFLLDEEGETVIQTDGKFFNLKDEKTYYVYGDLQKPTTSSSAVVRNHKEKEINQIIPSKVLDHLDGLASGPKVVTVIKCLTVLSSCAPDPSLKNDNTETYWASESRALKHTTLKSCLTQIIHEIIDAFLVGDKAMSKIETKLIGVPAMIQTIIESSTQPDDPDAVEMLEFNRKTVSEVTNDCKEEIKCAVLAFQVAKRTIDDLIEVATETKAISEGERTEMERLKIEYDIQKKDLEEKAKEYEERIKKHEKIVQAALEDAEGKSRTMGSLGTIFFVYAFDIVADVAKNVVPFVLPENELVGVANTFLNIMAVAKESNDDDGDEQSFVDLMVNYFKAHSSLKNREELNVVAPQEKKFFEDAVKFVVKNHLCVLLQQQTNEYINLLDNVAKPDSYEKIKSQFDLIKTTVHAVAKEFKKKKEAANNKRTAAANYLKEINNNIRAAQEDRHLKQKELDEMLEKSMEFKTGIARIQAQLASGDHADIRLVDIIKNLKSGLMYLEIVKTNWLQQQKFFDTIDTMVSDRLSLAMKHFLNVRKNPNTKSLSKFISNKWIGHAVTCCDIILQVIQCTLIYQKVSKNYILPPLLHVQGDMHQELSQTGEALERAMNTMDTIESQVLDFVKEEKELAIIKTNEVLSQLTELFTIIQEETDYN